MTDKLTEEGKEYFHEQMDRLTKAVALSARATLLRELIVIVRGKFDRERPGYGDEWGAGFCVACKQIGMVLRDKGIADVEEGIESGICKREDFDHEIPTAREREFNDALRSIGMTPFDEKN